MRSAGYASERGFAPVTLVMSVPSMIVVHPSAPARTVPEVVTWMKAQPGGVNHASSGVGSSEQPGMELFRLRTGTEAGLPDLVSGSWTAVVAPAATPAPAIDRLNAVMVATLRAPEVRERLGRLGFTVDASSRAELAQLIAGDLARWRDVVRQARIEPQ